MIFLPYLSNYHDDIKNYHGLYSFKVNVYVYTYIKGNPTAERKMANGISISYSQHSTLRNGPKKSCSEEKVLNW